MAAALLHHGHIIAFLGLVRELTSRRLPKKYRSYRWYARPSVLQLYVRDPAIHYEVWVQRTARAIEVGLHFEGERAQNRRWAEALAERALEIQSQLGRKVELEEWGKGWARLHETHAVGRDKWQPKYDSTDELAEQTAERLTRYVEVLEPVLAEEKKRVAATGGPDRANRRGDAGGGAASPSVARRRQGRSRPP